MASKPYAIFRKPTRLGFRFYYLDNRWRLRLMGSDLARLHVEGGQAVLSTDAPAGRDAADWVTS